MKKNLVIVKFVQVSRKIIHRNLIIDSTTDNFLNISSSEQIDLDVFLNKPAYFPYCHCESIDKCSDFEVFSFA